MANDLSPKQERALAVARNAWSSAVPTSGDTEGAVQRIRPRLRSSRRRFFGRSAGKLTVIFVVLASGLAWAADGGSRFAALDDGVIEQPLNESTGAARAAAVRAAIHVVAEHDPVEASEFPLLAEDLPVPAAATDNGKRRAVGDKPLVSPASETDLETATASRWRTVRDALAGGDEIGAQKALAELADQKDPNTQIKAELGLAQLALARGDCKRATAISARILSKDASAAMRKRAVDIAMQCYGR